MLAERSAALDTIAGHVVTGDLHVATVASGGLEVIDSLLRLLHPREAPPELTPEVFVDPVNVSRLL